MRDVINSDVKCQTLQKFSLITAALSQTQSKN